MKRPEKELRIGELLIEAGLINPKQLQDALNTQAKQGGKVAEILISLGHIDAPTFLRFLQKASRTPSIHIDNYEITQETLSLVPREFALKHEVLPIDRLANLLTLAMACPLDSKAIEELERTTGLKTRPILCSADDVRAAINRYYREPDTLAIADEAAKSASALESPLRLSGVAAMIRAIASLPALPKTVDRARSVLVDPAKSARDLAEIISEDPGLAAKVLSVANSAAYGFPQRVDDLAWAVALLGVHDVYGIVLAATVVDWLGRKDKFDHERFSADSLCCAATARAIALASHESHLAGVFTAGLLHDLGRLALAEAVPGLYAKIDPALRDLDLVAVEERVMGIGHPEAGYELAMHWHLPADISEPIRYHHHPELCESDCATLPCVALAVQWNRAVEHGFQDEREVLLNTSALIERVGLTVESAKSVLTWLKTFVSARPT